MWFKKENRSAEAPSAKPAAAAAAAGPAVSYVTFETNTTNEGTHRTSTIRAIFKDHVDAAGKTVVDLGAGPCIFSKIARDAGGKVTAVDGRTVRVPPLEELGDIEFVHADIREFDVSSFDIKLILGLFYHLEVKDQIDLLKRCAGRGVTILDTQVHWHNLMTMYPWPEWQRNLSSAEGYEGIFFPEDDKPTASIGNHLSFWPTESALIKMIHDAGFTTIKVVDPAYVSKYNVRRFIICS